MASLPGNGERGLKLATSIRQVWIRPRFAPRQRGARIETLQRGAPSRVRRASLPGNGERGLKPTMDEPIEQGLAASLPGNGERGLKPRRNYANCIADGFAPRQRGARIETPVDLTGDGAAQASLPGNGERGLKL